MANNRHTYTSGEPSQIESGNGGSPNPLYLATSQSEHSTLNRHSKPTLAEISASRDQSGNQNDEIRHHMDREKRYDTRRQHQQQQQLNPNSRASRSDSGFCTDNNTVTLERPDPRTWDRHAAGRTQILGTLPRSSPSPSKMSGSYAPSREEETPSKSSSLGEEKLQQQPPAAKPMQARSIRLSLGASTDLGKEQRKIPANNCPEKIVLCLDVSKEMESLSFRLKNGDKVFFVTLIKKALGIFCRTKHLMNAHHEFALMFLNNSCIWMFDFSSDPQKVMTILDDITNLAECDSCELSSIFDEIGKHVKIPPDSDGAPPYVVRVILIYGRSNCIPQLKLTQRHRAIGSSSCFCVDVLYVHDPPTAENNCEKIFDTLCDLDERGTSYILEASKNPTKVFDCMAQLLAHPLQRCLEKNLNYCVEYQP